MLCFLVNAMAMSIVSLRWKISLHTSGIALIATVLIYSASNMAEVLIGCCFALSSSP